jgi:hypothetical protein
MVLFLDLEVSIASLIDGVEKERLSISEVLFIALQQQEKLRDSSRL